MPIAIYSNVLLVCAALLLCFLYGFFTLRRLTKERDFLSEQFYKLIEQHQLNLDSKLAEQKAHYEQLLAQNKEKAPLTTDAQQILHDMTTHGSAVVRIIPLSLENLFYRSPK